MGQAYSPAPNGQWCVRLSRDGPSSHCERREEQSRARRSRHEIEVSAKSSGSPRRFAPRDDERGHSLRTSRSRHEARQALLLPSLAIEVVAPEPALEGRLASRPFAVEHREPGGVAVAALDDHVLAENTLEGEAQALRRAPRRRVERVALPFVTAIAERIENIGGEE